jgi:hypothetical protein
MIPGRKIMAIFGFVAIHNFTDVTEVLEERVMIFANEIAEIVHNVCDSFHGATNKNLGDCFLVVWKFKESEKLVYLNEKEEICINKLSCGQNYTDLSLIGFLKTLACAHKLSLTEKFVKFTHKIHIYIYIFIFSFSKNYIYIYICTYFLLLKIKKLVITY